MKSEIGALVSPMGIHQARTEVIKEELIVTMYTCQERMEAKMNTWQEGTKACLERKEPNPVEMAKVPAHLKDLNEVTSEETVWTTDNQSK
jgi:hypothetical protein